MDFDKLSTYDWDMESVDRTFDRNKINNYLNSIDDQKQKEIVKIIIDNTVYLSYQQLKSEILKQINKLPDKINLLFLLDDRIGSEHWLTVLFWPYLKPKVIKIITNIDQIDNPYPIVIIDDVIYSGHQMMGRIDQLNYDYKQKYDTKILNEFLVIVAAASKNGLDCILNNSKQLGYNVKIFVDIILSSVYELIPNFDHDYMYETFKIEPQNVPIYLDHKISGEFSSCPNIYTHIVKELPSRYKIEELSKLINKLQ